MIKTLATLAGYAVIITTGVALMLAYFDCLTF